jgi:LSD1 subclass zinc finger protein
MRRAAGPEEFVRAVPDFLFPVKRCQVRGASESSQEVFTMHMSIDLKICEGCGSLWYRATGATHVYCAGCTTKLGEFPMPQHRKRPGARRKQTPHSANGRFQVVTGGAR